MQPLFHDHLLISYPPCLTITIPELVSIAIHVCVVGYLGSWNKEAACQARGILKRQVVRPVRSSLSKIIVGD
jgi:hypothetical protein